MYIGPRLATSPIPPLSVFGSGAVRLVVSQGPLPSLLRPKLDCRQQPQPAAMPTSSHWSVCHMWPSSSQVISLPVLRGHRARRHGGAGVMRHTCHKRARAACHGTSRAGTLLGSGSRY